MKNINIVMAGIITSGILALSFDAAAQPYTDDMKQKLSNAALMDQCLFNKTMPIDQSAAEGRIAKGEDAEAVGRDLYTAARAAATVACESEYGLAKDDYTLPDYCPPENFIARYPITFEI